MLELEKRAKVKATVELMFWTTRGGCANVQLCIYFSPIHWKCVFVHDLSLLVLCPIDIIWSLGGKWVKFIDDGLKVASSWHLSGFYTYKSPYVHIARQWDTERARERVRDGEGVSETERRKNVYATFHVDILDFWLQRQPNDHPSVVVFPIAVARFFTDTACDLSMSHNRLLGMVSFQKGS